MGSAPAQLVSLGKGEHLATETEMHREKATGRVGRRVFVSLGKLQGHQGLGARPGTGSPLLAFRRNPRDNTFTWDLEPPALWEDKFLLIKPRSLENQYSHQPKESGSFAVGHPPRGKLAPGVSGQPKRAAERCGWVMPFSYTRTPKNAVSSFCKMNSSSLKTCMGRDIQERGDIALETEEKTWTQNSP